MGIGLRSPHFSAIRDNPDLVDWVELIAENHILDGGPARDVVESLIGRVPMVVHAVGLNLAGAASPHHEQAVLDLVARVDAPWFSDHLCLTAAHVHSHELLPVPHHPQVAAAIIRRIDDLQQRSGRLFAIENVSSYLQYAASTEPEWAFVRRIVEGAGCALLLDLNNVYVNAFNHDFDPLTYLDALPLDRVVQIHLAGHRNEGDHLLDTHDQPICTEVWDLYRKVTDRIGAVSTLIEWDDAIPALESLLAEADRARDVLGSQR